MDIKRAGSQPSGKGPTEWFTGVVRIDPLFPVTAPARPAGNAVTFEPGARTAWHTHPLGQVLIITMGCGRVQREGGPIEEIRPGDVVVFAPGKKHWHRRRPHHRHDPPRHPGSARRQSRRLVREGQRRAVPALTSRSRGRRFRSLRARTSCVGRRETPACRRQGAAVGV